MLTIARQLVEQSERVTVSQLQEQLGGGTLAEIGAVLRAAKMERGQLPWAGDTLPLALCELIRPPTDEGAAAIAPVELNADQVLAPLRELLAATSSAITEAITAITATAEVRVAVAAADAARQAREAWNAVQDMSDAMHAVEQARSEAETEAMERSVAEATLRHSLESQLAAAEHTLAGEARRARTLEEALTVARSTGDRLQRDTDEVRSALSAVEATLVSRAQRAEERAAVAEARVSYLLGIEPQLADALARMADARSTAVQATTELAVLQRERHGDLEEIRALRASLAEAHARALEAAALAGAQERELTLLNKKASGRPNA